MDKNIGLFSFFARSNASSHQGYQLTGFEAVVVGKGFESSLIGSGVLIFLPIDYNCLFVIGDKIIWKYYSLFIDRENYLII